MIRRLRRRHRAGMMTLVVVLPGLYGASLLVREEAPRVAALPEFAAALPPADPLRRSSSAPPDRWRDLPITVSRGDGEVSLRAESDLRSPEVLLYWTGDEVDESLPESAVLLGALAGRTWHRYPLPAGALSGRLVLYSLGHQKILGVHPLGED